MKKTNRNLGILGLIVVTLAAIYVVITSKPRTEEVKDSPTGKQFPSECPRRTDDVKQILDCSHVPESIKEIIKKQNHSETRDDCDFESKTADFVLGPRYISWTLVESGFCEGNAHPNSAEADKTFEISTGKEIIFPSEFDISAIEKFYLSNIDLKSSKTMTAQVVVMKLVKYPGTSLFGGPRSELSEAQFRLLDEGAEAELQVRTHINDHANRGCNIIHRFKMNEWRRYLLPDSKLR